MDQQVLFNKFEAKQTQPTNQGTGKSSEKRVVAMIPKLKPRLQCKGPFTRAYFARCDCHPGVCNKIVTVYEARYPLTIRCNLSSTLSSVKHILQDVNHLAQNHSCKQPLTHQARRGKVWVRHGKLAVPRPTSVKSISISGMLTGQ